MLATNRAATSRIWTILRRSKARPRGLILGPFPAPGGPQKVPKRSKHFLEKNKMLVRFWSQLFKPGSRNLTGKQKRQRVFLPFLLSCAARNSPKTTRSARQELCPELSALLLPYLSGPIARQIQWGSRAPECNCTKEELFWGKIVLLKKHIFHFLGKNSGAIFGICCASPGPGVAGNGFSAKNDGQFRGRDRNPCLGDPFRGHFSFCRR